MSKRNKKEKSNEKKHYKKKKIRKGWIVINTRTGRHTHVRSEYGAGCLLLFIREDIEVQNEYLKESIRRLQDGADRKQSYVNKR